MAGEEFARTKDGIHNSYKSSPAINQLDWTRAIEYQDLTAYYRFMIELRKELPVLANRNADALEGISFLEENDAVIGFVIEDEKCSGKWNKAVIYYNPYTEDIIKALPDGEWHLITDGTEIMDMEGSILAENHVTLKPRSVTVLGR